MSDNTQYPAAQVQFLQATQDVLDAQQDYDQQPNQHRLRVLAVKQARLKGLIRPYIAAGVVQPKQRIEQSNNDLFTKQ